MLLKKKYYGISEVSKLINIKEHVIRHWDSIDPKTNKLRIEGLSIRTKGGTRFFNKTHIKKLESLKNILKENGKRNYSLNLASKIIIQNKNLNKNYDFEIKNNSIDSSKLSMKLIKIYQISNNLKKLLN